MRSRTLPKVSNFSMMRTVDELITYFDKSTVLSDEITSLLCRFSLSVTVSVLSVVSEITERLTEQDESNNNMIISLFINVFFCPWREFFEKINRHEHVKHFYKFVFWISATPILQNVDSIKIYD